jgi:hypothetical protein
MELLNLKKLKIKGWRYFKCVNYVKELEEYILKAQLEYKLIRVLNVIRLIARGKDTSN